MSALAKNSALQIGGKFLGTLFGIITFYLLLHYFGTDGFGYLTTALTFVAIFGVIVDFGLTLTTTQMISEHEVDEERILGNLLTLRTISALLFLAIAPLSALFIPGIKDVFLLVCIATGTSFFGAVAQTYIGVFQKRLALLTPVLGETANRLVSLLLIIVVGSLGLSLAYGAGAFFLGGLLQLLIMLLGTGRLVKLRPRLELSVWRQILMRSWPIGISIFFNLLYLKGDIFFMAVLGRSATEIGQYGSAYKVVDVTTMMPVTFMGIMLPLLTLAWSEKNRERFTTNLQNTFDLFAMIAIPFAVGAIMLGVPLMTFIKSDLILAGEVLAVLGPAAAVVFFNSLYGHAVVAVRQQKKMVVWYVVVAAVAVTGYLLYIPLYGAWAAAWVTLVSEALIGFFSFMTVFSVTKQFPRLKMSLRAALATLLMALGIMLVPQTHMLMKLSLGIAVYAVALMALGGPRPKDIARLFLPEKPPISV